MSRGPNFASYVEIPAPEGAGWRVRLEPARDFDTARARALGGRRVFTLWWRRDWEFLAKDRDAMARLLEELRDLNVAFLAAGPGWHAGSLFEALREEGLVSGIYHALVWRGGGRWEVSDR